MRPWWLCFLLQLLEKMREERGHVSDIIRQEFADRIVTTEDENRRIKNEISELRAKHRLEVERAKQEVEEIKQVKDTEMEEVHKRSAGNDTAVLSGVWDRSRVGNDAEVQIGMRQK